MFIGEYQHNIDQKGRIIVPAKFRELVGSVMYVTRGFEGCLSVYTQEDWMKVIDDLNKLPRTDANARRYARYLTGQAAECEYDSQGRIRIPSPLIEAASLDKACVVVGVNDHFEIWDDGAWRAYADDASENFEDIAASLTEYFK